MMKIPLYILMLFIITSKSQGQQVKVNSSFIIVVDNQVTSNVAGVRLLVPDTVRQIIQSFNGGYHPGELFIDSIKSKTILDSAKSDHFNLAFEYYGLSSGFSHHYEIEVNKQWLKQPYIILKILNTNKRKGSYKYSFEIPGISFGKNIKSD